MKKIKHILILILLLVFVNITAYSSICHVNVPKISYLTIKVHYPGTISTDTLELLQSVKSVISEEYDDLDLKRIFAPRQEGGWYYFKLKISNHSRINSTYISLAKLFNPTEKFGIQDGGRHPERYFILTQYFVQAGDNISIEVKPRSEIDFGRSTRHNFAYVFSGKGALKYTLRYTVDSLAYHTDFKDILNSDMTYNPGNFENEKIRRQLAIVEIYKVRLGKIAYDELKSHCIFSVKYEETKLFAAELHRKLKNQKSDSIRKVILKSYTEKKYGQGYGLSDSTLLNSFDFPIAELGRQMIIAKLKYGDLESKEHFFEEIKNNDNGQIRERVAMLFLKRDATHYDGYNNWVKEAISFVSSPENIAELKKMETRNSGFPAYDFALPDTAGNIVKLSDFKGKIIFVDFWFTGCAPCSNYYKNELAAVEEQFKHDPEVVFISISIDGAKSVWINSVKSQEYTSSSIINLYTGGKAAKSDVIRFYNVVGYPQPMIINQDQKVFLFNSTLRNGEVITKTINQLKGK